MRFPSIDLLVDRLWSAVRRFPAVVPASLTATIALWVLIDGSNRDQWVRIWGAAALGFPLLTALHLLGERRQGVWRLGLPVAGLIFLAVLVPLSLRWTDEGFAVRLQQLALLAHLAAAIAWFVDGPERAGFWQFNRLLFERYLVATVFSVVLAIGLAVALLAIDRLLGIDVDGEMYPRIFAAIGFLVHPWFFLAGVPTDRDALDRSTAYPLGLKVFAQYVLIPLVTVYLAILTAYLGRVIVTRQWPSGWIGWLVSSVAVTGTLALLLVHPQRERAEGRWINGYGRWFFVALIPALAMLLMAVGKRIAQYGVTEPRYALAVLGGWLLLLSGYFAITRSRSIRIIPTSLFVVTAAVAIGPWGMTATARRSQFERFERIAAGGRFRGEDSTARADAGQLSDIARYLWARHGPSALAQVTGVDADSIRRWADSTDVVGTALTRFGVAAVPTGYEPPFTAAFRPDERALVGIQIDPGTLAFGPLMLLQPLHLLAGRDTISVRPARGAGVILIANRGDTAQVQVTRLVDSLRQRSGGRPMAPLGQPIRVDAVLGTRQVAVWISEITWARTDSSNRSVTGSIVVTERP